MAKPAKNDGKTESSSKKSEFNFSYYLYKGGRAHWQCNNIVGGSKGYPISKEDYLKSEEHKNNMWEELEAARLKKDKKDEKAEPAEQ